MYVFDIISQEDVVFELYRWLYLIKTKSVHYRALKKSLTISKFLQHNSTQNLGQKTSLSGKNKKNKPQFQHHGVSVASHEEDTRTVAY